MQTYHTNHKRARSMGSVGRIFTVSESVMFLYMQCVSYHAHKRHPKHMFPVFSSNKLYSNDGCYKLLFCYAQGAFFSLPPLLTLSLSEENFPSIQLICLHSLKKSLYYLRLLPRVVQSLASNPPHTLFLADVYALGCICVHFFIM